MKDLYQGIASTGCGKLVVDAKSPPQALKRGYIFSDLTARLKSCPSQDTLQLEFFRNLFKPPRPGLIIDLLWIMVTFAYL